jgi:phosphoribosylamine--glycine ligase/phosphoribosylformylglycinamidine cyclo-ligase
MEGDEVSISTFSDGQTFVSLPPGQDHKHASDDNEGLNAGSMGVYSPVPFVTTDASQKIDDLIPRPTFAILKAEGKVLHRSTRLSLNVN